MTTLLGFVGPGARLGFLGSLLVILAVIAVGLLGLVLYPMKLVMARQPLTPLTSPHHPR